MDISKLGIEDLVQLREDVGTRLQSLVAARQEELQAEVDRLAAINGKGVVKGPKRIKYQKGQETWSGTGSQPAWVKQHLALGGKLEDLLTQ